MTNRIITPAGREEGAECWFCSQPLYGIIQEIASHGLPPHAKEGLCLECFTLINRVPEDPRVPGEMIEKVMKFKKFDLKKLAARMRSIGCPMGQNQIAKLIDGEIKITEKIAYYLGNVLGQKPIFWMMVQENYDSITKGSN